MRVVWKIALALCLLPGVVSAASDGAVYRWVDENGVVNYTQLKPEGVAAERVSANGATARSVSRSVSSAPASGQPEVSSVNAEGASDVPLTEAQERMLEDLKHVESERQAEISRIKKANCEEARSVLNNLTSRGRIRVIGDDGEYRVMPEEERQERIDTAQKAVALNCAG